MNIAAQENLIAKLRTLSAQQVAEVEDFVKFLAAVGVEPPSEDEIAAEVEAARTPRGQPMRTMENRA